MNNLDFSKYQLKSFNFIWICLFSVCFILSESTLKGLLFTFDQHNLLQHPSIAKNIFYIKYFCIFEIFYSFIIIFGSNISNYNQQIVLTKMGIIKESVSFSLLNFLIFFISEIKISLKIILPLVGLIKLLSVVIFTCSLSLLDKENDLTFCENIPKEE